MKNAEFYIEFGNVIHIFLSAHLAAMWVWNCTIIWQKQCFL